MCIALLNNHGAARLRRQSRGVAGLTDHRPARRAASDAKALGKTAAVRRRPNSRSSSQSNSVTRLGPTTSMPTSGILTGPVSTKAARAAAAPAMANTIAIMRLSQNRGPHFPAQRGAQPGRIRKMACAH